MRTLRPPRLRASLALAAGLAAAVGGVAPAASDRRGRRAAGHVLLLSVDELDQSDLRWFVHTHPRSALARLTDRGVEFTRARTPVPSDSFPGLIAQITGGNPSSTGIYHDDTYNRALLPAGTRTCAGAPRGAEVTYFEALDRDSSALDGGQGLTGLPDSILGMTSDPRGVIDPARLPVDPRGCRPVYQHRYLKDNTVFEVASAAGLRTAWSDKHPAYEILDGPSGAGVQDLFTPEINSDAPTAGSGQDWTKDNALTERYDAYKVQAVIDEPGPTQRAHRRPRRRRARRRSAMPCSSQTVASARAARTSHRDAHPGSPRNGPQLGPSARRPERRGPPWWTALGVSVGFPAGLFQVPLSGRPR